MCVEVKAGWMDRIGWEGAEWVWLRATVSSPMCAEMQSETREVLPTLLLEHRPGDWFVLLAGDPE
jgi:hypothetical protein